MTNGEFESYLSDEKALDTRRQELIRSLLKQREAFNHEIDQKLARLGYKASAPKRGRPPKLALRPAA